jgi:hypothetical protein
VRTCEDSRRCCYFCSTALRKRSSFIDRGRERTGEKERDERERETANVWRPESDRIKGKRHATTDGNHR